MNSLVGIDTRWKLLVQVHSPLATHGEVEKVFREYAYENWLLRTSRRAYPSWTEDDWTRAPRLRTTEFSLFSLSFLFNPLSCARLFTEAPTHSRNILSLSLALNTNERSSVVSDALAMYFLELVSSKVTVYVSHLNVLYTLYIYLYIYRVFCSFFFFLHRTFLILIDKVSVSSQAYVCVYMRCSCIHINKKIARTFIIILIHPSRTNYYIKWYFVWCVIMWDYFICCITA